ncbi:trace amine-associated receptor 4-like [Haliotis rufescens]|uniref:trace amine-associated receptor 4-like n=1 Tax=Haliotis rufescens TaxID=6454 RepID=UPI00201EC190|nr:trace amine-associated receptor 4-like [Haliotis rufescens]
MNDSVGFIVRCFPCNSTFLVAPLTERVAGGGSYLLLGVLSFLANGILLLLLCRHRKLRSPAGWIMFNMAASDSLRAVTVIVFVTPMVSLSCFPFTTSALRLFMLMTLTCFLKSVISIMFVATDRYFAVCRPLHYVRVVTKTKVMASELGSWFISLLYALSFLVTETGKDGILYDMQRKSYLFYIYVVVPWVSLFCTVVLYCLMLRGVRRRRKVSCAPSMLRDLPQYRPQVKLAVTMAIVTGIFLLSNLPIVCVGSMTGPGRSPTSVAWQTAGFLFYISCVLNPVVYVATFRPIRDAARKMWCGESDLDDLATPAPRATYLRGGQSTAQPQ